jgi:hypothetical protein
MALISALFSLHRLLMCLVSSASRPFRQPGAVSSSDRKAGLPLMPSVYSCQACIAPNGVAVCPVPPATSKVYTRPVSTPTVSIHTASCSAAIQQTTPMNAIDPPCERWWGEPPRAARGDQARPRLAVPHPALSAWHCLHPCPQHCLHCDPQRCYPLPLPRLWSRLRPWGPPQGRRAVAHWR